MTPSIYSVFLLVLLGRDLTSETNEVQLAIAIRAGDIDAVKRSLEIDERLASKVIGKEAKQVLKTSRHSWPTFQDTFSALHILGLPPSDGSDPDMAQHELAIAAELLRHGANVSTMNAGGETAVDVALVYGRDELARFLILVGHSQQMPVPSALDCLHRTPKSLELVLALDKKQYSEDEVLRLLGVCVGKEDWPSVAVLMRKFGRVIFSPKLKGAHLFWK